MGNISRHETGGGGRGGGTVMKGQPPAQRQEGADTAASYPGTSVLITMGDPSKCNG